MSTRFIVLSIVTLAFAVLTGYALLDVGYWGIFDYHRHSSAGWQVIADLVIACGLAVAWMIVDARRTGRAAWPYVLITLGAGSFGPLFYLLMGEWARTSEPSSSQ